MKICLVAEGCYPYVVGGVSSWIQSLIKNFPEHEFIILAINPEKKMRGKFKYDLPDNVVEIYEYFFDEMLEQRPSRFIKVNLSESENQNIINLLSGKKLDWNVLFSMFVPELGKDKLKAIDLVSSEAFYEIAQEAYSQYYLHVPFTDTFWTLRAMYTTVFSLLEEDYPVADLYHSVSTGYAGVVASKASYIFNKPMLVTEHGIYTREREEELIKSDWVMEHFKGMWINYFKAFSDVAYQSAFRVISLFEKNRRVQVELGCSPEKTEVIHNGIDLCRYDKLADVIKGPDEPVVIAGIVRVVPIKDIKTMIQAFKIVEDTIDNVEFLIIGPTDENEEYYEECLQFTEAIGLQNVTYTGRVQVSEIIKNIDIHVLSSISEGQPLTVLETLACKIPNVTTEVGSCMSLIYGDANDSFGDAGTVVGIMDYKGMADAIIELALDPEKRRIQGLNGYMRMDSNYRFDDFVEGYRKIYKEAGDRKWPV